MSNNKSSLTQSKPDDAWLKKLAIQSGLATHLIENENIVYLLIDCSTSMGSKNKLEQAQRGALKFAYEAWEKEYAVGLITFSSEVEHVFSPQRENVELEDVINQLTAGGLTNMTAALILATEQLIEISGQRVICVVTDGMPMNPESALKAGEEAKALGIEIMAIGTDDADKSFLDKLVTQKHLSVKVANADLEKGISSMANLLPEKIK